MKVEEATAIVAEFFNDLIGAWVPGAVLAAGLVFMHLGPSKLLSLLQVGETASAALTFAGVLFALGHALLGLYELGLKWVVYSVRIATPFEEGEAVKRQSYTWFAELVRAQQSGAGTSCWGFHDLRNVALSVSSEAASTGRRFMFIALLCNGVGTALVILAVDLAACSMFAHNLLFPHENAAPWGVQLLMLLCVSMALFKRGADFHSRAMTTPFAVAVAELKLKKDASAGKATPSP